MTRRERRSGLLLSVAATTHERWAALSYLGTVIGMISGIHHLGLTVRDVNANAAWYERVLGFRRTDHYESPDDARHKVFLRHDGLGVRLRLTQHNGGSRASSTRRTSVSTTSPSP